MAFYYTARYLIIAANLFLPLCFAISIQAAIITREGVSSTQHRDAESESRSTCIKPIVRKEWRTLSFRERKNYLSAVQCLMNKPPLTSKSDIPGVTNSYEDFLGTHIVQADYVHFVGVFYPFHRLLVATYEKALNKCGYKGAQPYWDWTLDTGSSKDFQNSPIFDPETGLAETVDGSLAAFSNPEPGLFIGSDIPDRTGGGCIIDGPFKNVVLHLGPGLNTSYNPHCIRRDFAPDTLAKNSGKAMVENAMSLPDYGWFERTTEFSIHPGGHWGIGGLYGTMGDKWASLGDPIFYLHHANLDRVWWSWQLKNLSTRLTDMSGPLVEFDYSNKYGCNATLETEIHIGSTANVTAKVRDVMDIQGDVLCYTYDKLYS